MWQRRSYDGERCTVKYEGLIPPWGDAVALGVEFDNPERGRNNGSLDGVQYFETRLPMAGSFVRASRPADGSASFSEAVRNKYCSSEESAEIPLSVTQFVKPSDSAKQDVSTLKVISVTASLVKELECPLHFQQLERLDLGENLIEEFRGVPQFLSQFPRLRAVRLSGNRFCFDPAPAETCDVAVLEMAHTALVDAEAPVVLQAFPKLQKVTFAHNLLTKVPESSNVVEMDLSYNCELRSAHAPNLAKASFRGTSISRIVAATRLPKCVDLCETGLARDDEATGVPVVDWASVSEIAAQGVTELDILGPFNTHDREFVIARCGALVKLDGTPISRAARDEAERSAIAAVLKSEHPPIDPARWNELVARHGMPCAGSRSIDARLIRFFVDGKPLTMLGDAPIYRLRALVARLAHADVELDGVADVDETSVWQVRDLVSEGQHLRVRRSAS